ncbi:hypothetical protein BB561_003767 [Smittium simulii]|uniref:Uncharacterized protein n=1 Tax=Smittium simulii TaxID=133385 RepID=A0A2T9YJK6_9FUNG|nr:hypothetical protein BB561_003767 [Smittium simulii]
MKIYIILLVCSSVFSFSVKRLDSISKKDNNLKNDLESKPITAEKNEKNFNEKEIKKLISSKLWKDILKDQSPDAKKKAENNALQRAKEDDNLDSNLNAKEASAHASNRALKLQSKLELISE